MSLSSREEISRCVNNLETGRNVDQSLHCLFQMESSLEVFKIYGVKQLVSKYSDDVQSSEIAKKLMNKIRKMEVDSSLFRKPYDVRRPGSIKRSLPSSFAPFSKFPSILPDIYDSKVSKSSRPSPSKPSIIVKKVPELMDVSKLENLEESDYDSVRPTLTTLSAKQLKSFMDRNPRIERIADGLFRRHCQRDCPEEVPKKLKIETWRTVHDVHINWKSYEETKRWEKNLKEELENLEEIEERGLCRPFIISRKQSDLLELTSPMIFSCNSPMKNWANFSNGILTIHEKLIEKRMKENNKNYTCVYTEIIGGEELSNGTLLVTSSRNEITIEPGIPTEVPLEQFVVFCREPSGYHFYNKTFFNFNGNDRLPSQPSNNPNGLIVFSISGMSHNQAMRHLKKTMKFVSKNDFQSFSMFNQESNNNWNNSMTTFGEYEKIWSLVSNSLNGCSTFLHTDSSKFSKLFGDHFDYHSNLYNYFNRQYLGQVNNCITDGSVTVEDAISLWINFTKFFHNYSSHFSLLHLTEIATPDDGKVANLDEILEISLQELVRNGILKDTTVVILSDGGSENSSVYTTESGRIESRFGLFLIRLSDKFNTQYSEASKILKYNVDRLITNRDVSETLHSLISMWNDSNLSEFKRSLLFTRIPETRLCEGSDISENLCICSKSVHIEDQKRSDIAEELLKIVKREVSAYKCLSKIEIVPSNLEFRKFGLIHFFQFEVLLTTEKVKISETEGFSNTTRFKLRGKARFSMVKNLKLELREPLILVSNLGNGTSEGTSDKCYQKVIKNFRRKY